MYSCTLCPKRMSRRDSLCRHLRTMHRTCPSCLTTITGIRHTCPKSENYINIAAREVTEMLNILPPKENTLSTYHGGGMNNLVADREVNNHTDSDASEENTSDLEEDNSSEEKENSLYEKENTSKCDGDNIDDESDFSDDSDIFTRQDDDLDSDITITSSEDEDNKQENDFKEPNMDEDDMMSEESNKDSRQNEYIFLEWPNEKYYLRSMWMRFGDGKIKLFEHCFWLHEFLRLSDARVLRKIRHATIDQFESFCELAFNMYIGNVYPPKIEKVFLLKNKKLIKTLGGTSVSPDRKANLMFERGADFIRRFVDTIEPLLSQIIINESKLEYVDNSE